jgi:beta-N-acetylhexosaminidase
MMPRVPTTRRSPPPRREPVRRRQLAVLAMAAVALLAGAVVGAGTGGPAARPDGKRPTTAAAQAARLPLTQQVGQLVVLRFAGTSPPGYVRRALRQNRVAGAILFRDNAIGPSQLRALTGALRDAAGSPAPIICVDH